MTKKNSSMRQKARAASVPCYHCTSTSANADTNHKHYKKLHPKILSTLPLFVCDRCGNCFNYEGEYKNHDCPRPAGMSSKKLDLLLIQSYRQNKHGKV